MGFYRVVMNGQYNGQDVKNMLYYRTLAGVDIMGLELGGAPTLAEQFKAEVWDDAWKHCVHASYMLESIDVYPFNEGFQLIYNLPYTLQVQEGGNKNGETLPPSAYFMIKFGFANAVIGQNLVAPKRGYVCIGGLEEDQQESGRMKGSFLDNIVGSTVRGQFTHLAEKLAATLESAVPPVVFKPIRVGKTILGVWQGYADVASARYEDRLLWRRSRMLED